MKFSAVVLTKNEEKNIFECLKTLDFCDEILIIDDNSKDSTIKITEGLKDSRIKIYQRELNNDFSAQRNFALEKARNDYVLFVDADERVEDKLKEEILLLGPEFDGYFIKRVDNLWGKELKHGEVSDIYLLRIGNKEKGIWVGKVHEQWAIVGRTRKLRNPLKHFPHPTASEFLSEINYYTDLRSKELFNKGVKSSFMSIIVYTKGKFFLNYVLKQGFRDGMQGLLNALLMSFHSFLVRGKLWLLWQKKGI